MNEQHADMHPVGPRVTLPFPVMTNAGFPHGLRCDTCKRIISEGQPYQEDIQGVYDGGDTLSVLRCVYCPAEGVPDADTDTAAADDQ